MGIRVNRNIMARWRVRLQPMTKSRVNNGTK